MDTKKGFIHRRLASFGYAIHGLRILFQTQFHAWVHLAATGVVIVAGLICSVTNTEWALLALATGLVWTAEAINTAIEFVVDLASPEHHELAGRAKDVAAAAVLLAAVTSVCIAAAVFVPRLMT